MKPTILLIASITLTPLTTFAANPALMITWKATSHVPAAYTGKALPTIGSPLTVSAAIIDNGRVIDPSSYSVRWYEDGNLSKTVRGDASFRSFAPRMGEDSLTLRASVPDYGGETLDTFIDIPVALPEIVIDSAKLPMLTPLFYFWNITDPSSLSVEWSSDENGTTVRAKNPAHPFEFAEASLPPQ